MIVSLQSINIITKKLVKCVAQDYVLFTTFFSLLTFVQFKCFRLIDIVISYCVI